MTKQQTSTLAIHPSTQGFGWMFFQKAGTPFDWGIAKIAGPKNAGALRRVEVLLDKYEPAVLALEDFDSAESRRSKRVRALYQAVVGAAKARGIRVCIYDREQVADALGGASTREETARGVAARIEALRPSLPNTRKLWMSEQRNMPMFSAAAVGIAHYANKR